MWIYTFLLQLYFTLLELTNCLQTPDLTQSIQNNNNCCNGILGYARPFDPMPCSEMKCCNETEIVALEKVNHALGFCFRCVLQTPDLTQSIQNNNNCCNGILGYARPFDPMPCSEMKCCNETESVALEKVNHALGFCFRCVQQTSDSMCYTVGQEDGSTNDTTIYYTQRTCCSGLKFKVYTYLNDVAMVIKCVHR